MRLRAEFSGLAIAVRKVELNQDFLDLLEIFSERGVRFLIVGAHALAVHGVPRATGDLDVWICPEPANAKLAWDGLVEFGARLEALGLEVEDLHHSGTVFQFGLPPRRIDILTQISGVEFAEAWDGRSTQTLHGLELPFLGRVHFERNKKASGRPKDLANIALLDESLATDRIQAPVHHEGCF